MTGWILVGVSLGKAGYCGVTVCAADGSGDNKAPGTTERQATMPSRKLTVHELHSPKPRSLPSVLIDGTSRHKECTGGKALRTTCSILRQDTRSINLLHPLFLKRPDILHRRNVDCSDIVRSSRFGVKLVEIVHDNDRQPVIYIAVMVAALQLTAWEL